MDNNGVDRLDSMGMVLEGGQLDIYIYIYLLTYFNIYTYFILIYINLFYFNIYTYFILIYIYLFNL
jgi:hypothetical protein